MNIEKTAKTDLDGLIQKIKTDGIEEANRKSSQIIEGAERKASEIVTASRQKAELIVKDAKEKVEHMEQITRATLQQSGRDVVLGIRNSLLNIFDALIKRECQKVLSPETLEKILYKIIEGWQRDKDGELDLEIVLNEVDRRYLIDCFLSKLQEKIKNGIDIKTGLNIKAGFHIGMRGGHFYYDLTDEGITDLLSSYLKPDILSLIGLEEKTGERG